MESLIRHAVQFGLTRFLSAGRLATKRGKHPWTYVHGGTPDVFLELKTGNALGATGVRRIQTEIAEYSVGKCLPCQQLLDEQNAETLASLLESDPPTSRLTSFYTAGNSMAVQGFSFVTHNEDGGYSAIVAEKRGWSSSQWGWAIGCSSENSLIAGGFEASPEEALGAVTVGLVVLGVPLPEGE